MSESLEALIRGPTAWVLAYAMVLGATLTRLIRNHASWRHLGRAPFIAAPLTLLAAFALQPINRLMGIDQRGMPELILGLAFFALAGYVVGAWWILRGSIPGPFHLRGAIVAKLQPEPHPPSAPMSTISPAAALASNAARRRKPQAASPKPKRPRPKKVTIPRPDPTPEVIGPDHATPSPPATARFAETASEAAAEIPAVAPGAVQNLTRGAELRD
jgi:hypothetical protein